VQPDPERASEPAKNPKTKRFIYYQHTEKRLTRNIFRSCKVQFKTSSLLRD
jgi:hypothetical protein